MVCNVIVLQQTVAKPSKLGKSPSDQRITIRMSNAHSKNEVTKSKENSAPGRARKPRC